MADEKIQKNMVFTSAGDNTNFFNWWLSDSQEYDVFLYYYGTNNDTFDKYKSLVHYAEKAKGSKFQNFYKFYKNNPEIIEEYDYFFIVDDDIEIKAKNINYLFNIANTYNLDICGPSFNTKSKISWPHTKHKANCILTYVNFVEVNVPLFSKEALKKLMDVYDPILIGWGIDFLATWANGLYLKQSYAIIHKIQCTNPKDADKKEKTRELNKIPDANKRAATWNEYAKSIGSPTNFKVLEYASINPRKTRKIRMD